MQVKKPRPGILLVANWDSNVGYAWWLMESFWVLIARHYQQNHHITLAYPSISVLPDPIKNAGIETHTEDFNDTSVRGVISQLKLIRQQRINYIYFSDKQLWHWRYCLYRLAGVKAIAVHDHTPGLRTVPKGLKKFVKILLFRIPWLTVDGAIGATDFIRKRIYQTVCFPERKCFSAPNGLPLDEQIPSADPHNIFDIPPERKIIVTTARANRYKGVGFALDVIANLIHEQKHTDIHYLFCGDGPDLDTLRKRAQELNISSHTSLPGRIDGPVRLLGDCDMAFHPSRGEVGYSLSILEYMQAGLPVIVPDNPSVCGATRNGIDGIHYTEGDVKSAAKAIEKTLNDSELQKKMSLSASNRIVGEFSLDNTHRQLLVAIESIFGIGKHDKQT